MADKCRSMREISDRWRDHILIPQRKREEREREEEVKAAIGC